MRAIQMTAAGEPSVLRLVEIEPPGIERETEMRVRLRAAGVNPIDTKLRRRGTFYPERMKRNEWLAYYATQFDCIEINNSFYRLPTAEQVARWAAQTDDSFRFALIHVCVPRR